MKKLLGITLSLILTSCMAAPVAANEFCLLTAKASRISMEMRQNEAPLNKVMKEFVKHELSEQEWLMIMRNFSAAYSTPIMKTASQKKIVIDEFEFVAYERCLENLP